VMGIRPSEKKIRFRLQVGLVVQPQPHPSDFEEGLRRDAGLLVVGSARARKLHGMPDCLHVSYACTPGRLPT